MLDFPRKPDIITFVLTREQNKKSRAQDKIAGLCKGSTTDSDSVCEGSNPSPAAKKTTCKSKSFFSLYRPREYSQLGKTMMDAGSLHSRF